VEQEGEAGEGREVRALDEARLGGPGGKRQRGRRGRGVGAPAPGGAVEEGEGGQDERRLEQHRAGDPRRPVGEGQDDLEQPGQVDVAGVGEGERQEVGARDRVRLEHDLAEPQVEEEIGLVHGDEAATGDEQHERAERDRFSAPRGHGGAIR